MLWWGGKMAQWMEYLTAGKTTLDLLKGVRDLIPKGAHADEVSKKIEEAEQALKTSEAELARKLGFRLCRCTWPPQIMRWDKDQRKNVCPACGDIWPAIRGLGAPRTKGR
jgi:hypothetical protein